MGRGGRWMPVAVTAAVAALLAGAAVVTADRAGCDQPSRYVSVPDGVQLIGGCLNSDDLPVAPLDRHVTPPPTQPLGDE